MPAQRRHYEDDRALLEDEPRRPPGRFGRWMMALGVLLAVAGVIVWIYVIIRERGVVEDDRDVVPGLSAPVLGFTALVVGTVLACVGASRARPR